MIPEFLILLFVLIAFKVGLLYKKHPVVVKMAITLTWSVLKRCVKKKHTKDRELVFNFMIPPPSSIQLKDSCPFPQEHKKRIIPNFANEALLDRKL